LRTFVAQTVTIGEQKVSPESESLNFSATPTPQVQNPSDSSTPTPQPWLLQMSCSIKQDMRSKLVMWLFQPIMSSWRQNISRSYFASWGKIDKAQKCMLCIIMHFWVVFGYG